MINKAIQAYQMGQSFWYDNIQKKLLDNGDLARMVELGEIYGVTSNPSIFHNAIGKTTDYDENLIPLAKEGKTPEEIYEALAIRDIQRAADIFSGVYQKSNKIDGYVSLEVNPDLANDTAGTIVDAERFWKLVNRPNLMIKIPATKAGLPAVRKAISMGINVNVTLIFSVERYQAVMEAFIAGLEDRLEAGKPIEGIASVASFFISRIDAKIDKYLSHTDNQEIAEKLKGKIAIANAKKAYQIFTQTFEDKRFLDLFEKNAMVQRPLWASTSTKDPAYPDVLYIDSLIGPLSVNTIPPATLAAFLDHGAISPELMINVEENLEYLVLLKDIGIDLDKATDELEEEGVAAFSKAYHALLDTIETRRLDAVG